MLNVMSQYMKADENDIKKEPGTTFKSESLSDRDAGFCSGDEETDLDTDYHSCHHIRTDTKDFVTDTFLKKRKCDQLSADDDDDDDHLLHATKLIKLERCSSPSSPCSSPPTIIKVEKSSSPPSPFRPWSSSGAAAAAAAGNCSPTSSGYSSPPIDCPPAVVQEEPLALVVVKKSTLPDQPPPSYRVRAAACVRAASPTALQRTNERPPYDDHTLAVDPAPQPQEVTRVATNAVEKGDIIPKSTLVSHEESIRNRCGISTSVIVARDMQSSQSCANVGNNGGGGGGGGGSSSSSSSSDGSQGTASVLSSHQQRNYKNMTRERRIEANARERTRVHTISAAFDTLRNCIPAYAKNQKLSKLSVLRVACSYIMTLSRIAGHDYSVDQSAPSLAECVDNVCNTIQMEGKTRKKKEDEEH